VTVQMGAGSINYCDHVIITGGCGIPQRALPFISVSDGAGEMVEIGPDVEQIWTSTSSRRCRSLP
jgi:NADPH:quinone reductase-like Zn-dependent oxidoreductase